MFKRITSGLLAFSVMLGMLGSACFASATSVEEDAVDVVSMEEGQPHEHTFACYESYHLDCQNTDKSHIHIADCYVHSGDLVCGLEEGKWHSHNDVDYECHLVTKVLVCDKEEHVHNEECMGAEEEDIPLAKIELPPTGFTDLYYPSDPYGADNAADADLVNGGNDLPPAYDFEVSDPNPAGGGVV